MPTPDTNGVPPFADFEDVKRKMNEMVKKYNNLLVNLDSLNVVSLTADHIDAGTINAGVVTIKVDYNTGASITIDSNGMTIYDGTKNTFRVGIDGQVTMTGATVQSTAGSYPRVLMSSSGNVFGVYQSADNYTTLSPDAFGSTPGLVFNNSSGAVGVYLSSGTFIIVSTPGVKIQLSSAQDLELSCGSGYSTSVNSWATFKNRNSNRTLQQDLDDLLLRTASLQAQIDSLDARVSALGG